MSVRVIGMVFEGGPGDLAQHSVMMALADNADDFGVAWPGVELLARKSRMSERNVMRVLAALESDGWLVVRRRQAGEHRRGNRYEMNLARLRKGAIPPEGDDPESPRKRKHAENTAAYAAAHDTVSPEPMKAGGEVTPEAREVTMTTTRGDMTLAQLVLHQRDALQNRQEPSLEPSTSPLYPPGGGSDARDDGEAHALTADEQAELAEVNAMRGRMRPPQPPLSWQAYAPGREVVRVVDAPARGRRRRWRGAMRQAMNGNGKPELRL